VQLVDRRQVLRLEAFRIASNGAKPGKNAVGEMPAGVMAADGV
jgi:hypothetical protein